MRLKLELRILCDRISGVFSTKVAKSSVARFVQDQTGDPRFTGIFKAAMETELRNSDEIKEWLDLFPIDDVGVPQGSSLSAFAGNVVLRDFDQKLNYRGIRTIRYIDDFVILARSERSARTAFGAAKTILGDLGMTAYNPNEDPSKAKRGKVSDGFDFLGCSIRLNGISPSRHSKKKLLEKLQQTLNFSLVTIKELACTASARRAQEGYLQVLARTDRIIRGWGDSYAFVDNRLTFHQLDAEIDTLLREFKGRARRHIQLAADDNQKRRAFGIALLKDTPRLPAE